jgi:glycolate oxidase FAD binding subunit
MSAHASPSPVAGEEWQPADEAGVAAAVSRAYAGAEPLLIRGNGSKQGLLRPVQAARTLSTRALTGITHYSPQELVLSARAGTPVADIAAAVAEKGQHLIAEPPDLGALLAASEAPTLGGVVAANLSGPRRIAWGAMRDHVLGVRAVNGMGETIHSGGRVLKNVTGLDLCKLLSGSYGTLAVLTEITLKVLPAPERRGTLVLRGLEPERAVAALAAALGSPYGVSGAAHLPGALAARVPPLAWFGGSVTLARIEDFSASVAYRAARVRSDLSAFGTAELLDDAATQVVWAAVRDVLPMASEPGAVWRVSVRPSAGPAVGRAAEAAFGAAWFMDWGGGLVWIAGPATEDAHAAVVRAARAQGGVWTLMRAPEPMRAVVEVIPSEAAPLARFTRAVKAAFDPAGILNPGRMYAGI